MLIAYLDESRKHDEVSGTDVKVIVGGAIAHADQWSILSKEWKAILDSYNIDCFHMSKFESRKGEFSKLFNDNGIQLYQGFVLLHDFSGNFSGGTHITLS